MANFLHFRQNGLTLGNISLYETSIVSVLSTAAGQHEIHFSTSYVKVGMPAVNMMKPHNTANTNVDYRYKFNNSSSFVPM